MTNRVGLTSAVMKNKRRFLSIKLFESIYFSHPLFAVVICNQFPRIVYSYQIYLHFVGYLLKRERDIVVSIFREVFGTHKRENDISHNPCNSLHSIYDDGGFSHI